MADETEVKLILPSKKIEQLIEKRSLNGCAPTPWVQKHIKNTYFDTIDRQLKNHKAALRIRELDGRFIQTVKTQGFASGGLAQRQEWEQEITEAKLNLELLPSALQALLDQDSDEPLIPVFNTDFTRQQCELHLANGTIIELAVDTGTISNSKQQEPLNELELELKTGNIEELFILSNFLIQEYDARMFALSKAERGYAMGQKLERLEAGFFVQLSHDSNVEESFVKAIARGFQVWQEAEKCFIRERDLNSAMQIRQAIQFVRDVIAIYSPVVLRKSSAKIRDGIAELEQQFAWLDSYHQYQELMHRMEKKEGLYSSLPKLTSFYRTIEQQYQQQMAGKLNAMIALMEGQTYQLFVLQITRWFTLREWRSHLNDKALVQLSQTVGAFGTKQLNTYWKELKAAFNHKKYLKKVDYYDQLPRLRKALNAGNCFGSLFEAGARNHFRQFWLDIFAGIEEFKEFDLIHQCGMQLEAEDSSLVQDWLNRQREGLEHALLSTRKAAIAYKPYWR